MMTTRGRGFVLTACAVLSFLTLLITVIAQRDAPTRPHPNDPSANSSNGPARLPEGLRGEEVRPGNYNRGVEAGLPKREPTPQPSPTPELGCSPCRTDVPFFDLGKDPPPSKVKLWEVLKADDASARVSFQSKSPGSTDIKLTFSSLPSPPAGSKYVVWARLAGDQMVALGELRNMDKNVEVSITRQLNSTQFGLFMTIESVDKSITPMGQSATPSGVIVATVNK